MGIHFFFVKVILICSMTVWLGLLTILIAVISYGFYLRDMLRGKTKPHGLTWLIWGTLNTFIFFQQLAADAGPGAWVTGSAALANLIIFALSFKYGERRVMLIDWFSLVAAVFVLVFWYQTSDAVLSVILACSISLLGFAPTIRKAWKGAHEETALTYALNSLKFLIALFALQTVNIVTALYPALLFVTNAGFAVYLLVRRARYSTIKHKNKRGVAR